MSNLTDRDPPPRNADSDISEPLTNGLSVRLKSFQHHIPLHQDNAYRYTCPSDKSNLVFYIEYRGSTAPPATIGAVGDVYLDTTPGNHKFYFRDDSNSWFQWIPDEKHLKKNTLAVDVYEHPFLTDVRLWIVETGLVWYPVGKIQFRNRKEWKSISSWTFHDEPMGRLRKRPRRVEEEDAVEGFGAKRIATKKSRVTEQSCGNGSGSKPAQPQISTLEFQQVPVSSASIDCHTPGLRSTEMLRLKEECSSLREKVTRLLDEITQARRRNQNRVSVVELALAKSEAYLLSSRSDIAKARDQINILETQNRELKDNIEAITADHAAIITGLNITNTQNATELQAKTKQITSLEEDISGLETETQTMMANFSSAQEHITALRDENAYLRENVRVQEEIGNARNHNIEDSDAHTEGRRPSGQREGEFSGRDMSGDTGSKTRHLTMIIEDLFLFSKRLEDDEANDSALIQDYKNDHSNVKLALDKVTTELEEATKRAEAAEATVNEWARQMHKLSSPHISR